MKISQNHSNSFFVEITLTVLFFAISATVILQLFASASQTARQSRDLSGAVVQAQSIAEEVRGLSAANDLPASLKNARQTGTQQYRLGFDKNWRQTAEPPYYVADISFQTGGEASGTMVSAEIRVSRVQSDSTNLIYTLHSSKYLPQAN